jgi:hypothetical protein
MTMEALDITVPITRAEHYPHEDAFDPKDGAAIQRLDTVRVSVNYNHVVLGAVTVTAHGPDPLDPYGYDFDLSPDAARDLARLLTEAAADAAGSEAPG